MEFWPEMKLATSTEPPDLIPMEALDKLRVGLKHNGNLPHPQTVSDLLLRSRGFFENVLKAYCGINYEEVSLLDMLPDSEVISLLRKSQADFALGKKLDAMLGLKFAFHKIGQPEGKMLPFLEAPEVPNVSYELREAGIERYLRQLHSFLEESAKATNAMLLKIDRLQYIDYLKEGPAIQWTMDGRAHVHYWDDYQDLTQQAYNKWRLFVIDYAFKAVQAYIPYLRARRWDGAPREYFIRTSE